MSAGIVTCPFDVMRTAPPYCYRWIGRVPLLGMGANFLVTTYFVLVAGRMVQVFESSNGRADWSYPSTVTPARGLGASAAALKRGARLRFLLPPCRGWLIMKC